MPKPLLMTLLFLMGTLICLPGCNTAPSGSAEFNAAIEAVKDGTSTKIVTANMDAGVDVNDDDIKKLEGLEGLRELRLNGSAITRECLHSVMLIPDLEILSLGKTRIKDEDLEIIAKHPKLVHLSLDESRVGDAGLVHVATIPNLRELSTWQCPVTDKGCASIAKMKNLTWLSLDQTRITGKGLMELKTLKNLKKVQAWGTGVTESDIDAFRTVSPDCLVTR